MKYKIELEFETENKGEALSVKKLIEDVLDNGLIQLVISEVILTQETTK